MYDYRTYAVAPKKRESTVRWLTEGLEAAGCEILMRPDGSQAPFRVVFKTPTGERLGAIFYLFTITSTRTKNRPEDEWRFQLKYGSKDGALHELWQDPTELHTTVLLGVDPDTGRFVAADPVLHSPTRLFISLEFKQHHMDQIRTRGWHAWERLSTIDQARQFETLVGGRPEHLLDLVRFERAAKGLDPGNRHLLAETWLSQANGTGGEVTGEGGGLVAVPSLSGDALHQLAEEFAMSQDQILDMIQHTPRLKMAVRGWVAEQHLEKELAQIPGVTDCARIVGEGQPDIQLRYRGSDLLFLECKNVLRAKPSGALAKVDFQRTRASKSDPCSRYYRREDFQIVAACMHAITVRWEFRFRLARDMAAHSTCPGRLAHNVKVDGSWCSAEEALAAVVGA